jgi:ribonucleoside-triphosphate reductase
MSNYAASMSLLQQYVYLSRYSRFLHEKGRRETWNETVARYFDFFTTHLKEQVDYDIPSELRNKLELAVLSMKVMPSMRCLMTAGPALARENVAGYNCSYLAIDSPKAFSELMYILLCGTGVGFSVERQYVNKLPEIPEELFQSDTTVVVGDSKLGWAKALNELISILYTGNIPKWDVSKVRPAGSILKVFGGRASGPEPLERLFKFLIKTFKEAKGRQLTSLECHDVACMVGEVVVSGGVRRSALISLSNLSDDRMRGAKTGQWWTLYPHRSISNNSAVYTEKRPSMDTFMSEWKALYDSKSGERGMFSRYASKAIIEANNDRRKTLFGDDVRIRDPDFDWGTNPCSEIILRDKQFCNLSEVVIRADDTRETLIEKARLAAILGTFQSTLTNFKFLSKKWKDNTADERLLGVSMTGIMDNKLTNGTGDINETTKLLSDIRAEVIKTNIEYAAILGIPASAATTAVKPSGTVSTLVDSASGIHARHAPYYLRSVRSDKKDPLAQVMIDVGIPYEEDVMRPDHNYVFYFPCKSPDSSVTRTDMTAIKQLQVWQLYQDSYTEHKPSVTISVKDDEWMDAGAYVFKHFDTMSGVSFLPFSDHSYEQAPYQDLTEEQYNEWVAKMPKDVDWSKLSDYEKTDMTTGSQELACTAGAGEEGVVSMGCTI